MRKIRAIGLIFASLLGASEIGFPCTMFTYSHDGTVLVGNNEDEANPDTKVWFTPAENGRYGGIYFGWDERWPQGGMNDQGLVFDILLASFLEITRDDGKPVSTDEFLTRKVMAEAANVEEAVAIIDRFSLQGMEAGQIMYVDRTGDAAIIEGDVIHRMDGKRMIATNFYHSLVDEATGVTCPRYLIVEEMLEALPPTVESFRKILDATHFEGNWGGTQYSNIYLPGRGQIHLFHFHNYEEVVILNMKEELAKGPRILEIADLFPRNFAFETYLESQPETVSDVLKTTYNERGAVATIDQAKSMKEGWDLLQPIFSQHYATKPVKIADRAQSWSPALVAGRHKTRQLNIGPENLKNLAQELSTRDQNHDAIQLLQANIDLYPGFLPNHYWLGVIFRDTGQYSPAQEQLQIANNLSPDNPWVLKALEQLKQARQNAKSPQPLD